MAASAAGCWGTALYVDFARPPLLACDMLAASLRIPCRCMATHPPASSCITAVQDLDDHDLPWSERVLCQDDLPVQGKVSA